MNRKRQQREEESETDFAKEPEKKSKSMQAVELATTAADTSFHSSSAFERLPTVLLHLCMQSLDFISLARLSRTCKPVAAASLHPSAGRFLAPPSFPNNSGFNLLGFELPAGEDSHRSLLFRTHAPIILYLPDYATFIESTREQPIQFKRIQTINTMAAGAAKWTEKQAIEMLQQPWLHGVTTVELLQSGAIWLESQRVQAAICRLPHLTNLHIRLLSDAVGPGRMSSEAIALATNLTHINVYTHFGDLNKLSFLAAASHLTHLTLSFNDIRMAWSKLTSRMPQTLGQLKYLQLRSCNIPASPKERAQLKLFFLAMPNVQTLSIVDTNVSNILRSLMKVGVAVLSSLRRVECSGNCISQSSLKLAVIRRFFYRFPLVELILQTTWYERNLSTLMTLAALSAWPQVIIQREMFETPLNHASDGNEEEEEDENDDTVDKEETFVF